MNRLIEYLRIFLTLGLNKKFIVLNHMHDILLQRNYSSINTYKTTVGNILYNVGNFETIASKSSYMPQYTKN